MTDSGYWDLLSAIAFSCLIYLAVKGIFRLLDHPLRRFPGPRLAALSEYYKAYYDIFRDGGWYEHIETLHELYGPVVRIAPNELHFSDPHAFATIYTPGSKFTKDYNLYKCFNTDTSSFGIINPLDSTIRRNLLNPLFSRRAILRLEGVVQTKVDKLITKLSSYESGKPANLHLAFRSATLDIITSYCFANCNDTLDAEDFRHHILVGMEALLPMCWLFKYFPIVNSILMSIPNRLAVYLNPDTKAIIALRQQMVAQIDDILDNPSSLENTEHETIYHHLLTPQPGKDQHLLPSRESLLQEGQNLRFAGSDTVGNTCTVGSFYILNNKEVYTKLVRELHDAWPDSGSTMSYEALEKLPYLTAVIKESLRMGHSIITPLPRVVGPTDAVIAGTDVPAGTVVAIASAIVHRNPEIFVDPLTFSPERWLQPDSRNLERHLVPFSRGPRQCLGMNLAWCELYLILGNVFRKLDLEADDARIEDLRFREYLVPIYRGKHLHARVNHRRNLNTAQ